MYDATWLQQTCKWNPLTVVNVRVTVARQATDGGALTGALRAHVQDERFATAVTAMRGLPLGVRDGLQTLFASRSLDIADPGAEFQRTRGDNPNLPTRRLVAAGCSNDHCLVYYERGGTEHTWHVALFYWTPASTRFEWGGTAPAGLATIEDVRNAVLSGSVKGQAKVW